MFETVETAPPDAILGLTEAFASDPNPEKINLSVGVYKDASGTTPILAVVQEAEAKLLAEEKSKSYRPIPGDPEYGALVRGLLFGPDSAIVSAGRAVTAHCPGGTGALRVAGDYLARNHPDARVWVSDPTWANHGGVFGAAGVDVSSPDGQLRVAPHWPNDLAQVDTVLQAAERLLAVSPGAGG